MTPSLLVAAAAFAALAPLAPTASADCADTGKLDEHVGWCTYGDRCASAYADATPRIMDDTFVVWACAGPETYACYAHARTYTCTNDRP